MTGLDPTRARDRRDRHADHRRRPRDRRRGSRPRRAPATRRRWPTWTTSWSTCTPQSACSRRSRRRRSRSRTRGRRRSRSSPSTCPTPATVPLCGNSIGTDRRFLAAYLPEIEDFLHYRSVDVSTVKELARRWYPEVVAGAAQGRHAPRPRRHPRERRRAAVLPRAPLRAAIEARTDGTLHGVDMPAEKSRKQPSTRSPRSRPGSCACSCRSTMPGLGHVNCYALEDDGARDRRPRAPGRSRGRRSSTAATGGFKAERTSTPSSSPTPISTTSAARAGSARRPGPRS